MHRRWVYGSGGVDVRFALLGCAWGAGEAYAQSTMIGNVEYRSPGLGYCRVLRIALLGFKLYRPNLKSRRCF